MWDSRWLFAVTGYSYEDDGGDDRDDGDNDNDDGGGGVDGDDIYFVLTIF